MLPKYAARVKDSHFCPQFSGNVAHLGGKIEEPGIETVLIGGKPAAVAGTVCKCEAGGPHAIKSGSKTVLINGMQAARLGDPTVHPGGMIISGYEKVIIGD